MPGPITNKQTKEWMNEWLNEWMNEENKHGKWFEPRNIMFIWCDCPGVSSLEKDCCWWLLLVVVTKDSLSQDYSHPDDQTRQSKQQQQQQQQQQTNKRPSAEKLEEWDTMLKMTPFYFSIIDRMGAQLPDVTCPARVTLQLEFWCFNCHFSPLTHFLMLSILLVYHLRMYCQLFPWRRSGYSPVFVLQGPE